MREIKRFCRRDFKKVELPYSPQGGMKKVPISRGVDPRDTPAGKEPGSEDSELAIHLGEQSIDH